MSKKQMGVMGLVLLIGVGVFFFFGNKKETKSSSTSSQKKIGVTTSFYPIAFLAEQVGGVYVSVANLTPPGTEPHDFEPTTKDIAELLKSKLFLMNGSGVEVYEEKLTEMLKGSPVRIAIVGREFATQEMVKEGTKRKDPHVWIDPVIFAKMGERVAQELGTIDAAHATYYKKNAEALATKLLAIDAEYKKELGGCNLNKIVTSHTAFGYLATRYGFEQIGISGLSPEEEPSPKELKDITDMVNKEGVKYILLEELAPRVWGETIAKETGAEVLVLSPIEGIAPEDREQGLDYFSVQKSNIETLRTALDCN